MTEYPREQILARRLEQPDWPRPDLSRRAMQAATAATRPVSAERRDAPGQDLVAALSHPNGWWRDTAQRLIVERSGASAAAAERGARTSGACRSAPDWRSRLHALWTLDGIDGPAPARCARWRTHRRM